MIMKKSIIRKTLKYSRYILSRRRKCVYIGWLGCGNWGDEVLFEVISNKLKPYALVIPSESVHKINRIIKLKINLKCILLGGGTLINNLGFYEDLKKYMALFPENCPLVVLGTGVRSVDFWKKYEKEEMFASWIEILKHAKLVGVRGPLSQNYLEQFGIRAIMVGDPALFLSLQGLYKKPREKRLLVNIGKTYGKLWGSEERFYAVLLKTLKKMAKNGWIIDFYSVWFRDDDVMMRFIEFLVSLCKRKPMLYKAYKVDSKRAIEFIKNYDLFMGEKLHAVIAAHSSYTPALIFEYRPKCLDYALSVGMEKYCISTNEVSMDRVIDLAEKLYKNSENIRNQIWEKVSILNQVREDFFSSVGEYLLKL